VSIETDLNAVDNQCCVRIDAGNKRHYRSSNGS
jgi:hypothetical protein